MATYRLIHVVRDGSGDTTGLAEYTNSDTVLMPVIVLTLLVLLKVNLYTTQLQIQLKYMTVLLGNK